MEPTLSLTYLSVHIVIMYTHSRSPRTNSTEILNKKIRKDLTLNNHVPFIHAFSALAELYQTQTKLPPPISHYR